MFTRPIFLTALLASVLSFALVLSIGSFIFVISPTSPTDNGWNFGATAVGEPFLIAAYLLAARGLWIRENQVMAAANFALVSCFVLIPGVFLAAFGMA